MICKLVLGLLFLRELLGVFSPAFGVYSDFVFEFSSTSLWMMLRLMGFTP